MAIDLKLFERVHSGRGLFAVESISLIYNALTSILILILFSRMDHPELMLMERLGIVVLTFGLIYLYQLFPCRLSSVWRYRCLCWHTGTPIRLSSTVCSRTWTMCLPGWSNGCSIASLRWSSVSSVRPPGSANRSIWGISFIIL